MARATDRSRAVVARATAAARSSRKRGDTVTPDEMRRDRDTVAPRDRRPRALMMGVAGKPTVTTASPRFRHSRENAAISEVGGRGGAVVVARL